MKLVPLLLALLPTAVATTNVALGKPTSASSEISEPAWAGKFPASKAVDGNASGDGSAGYDFYDNFISDKESDPWWEVNLQGTYAISEVIVYNRQKAAPQRLEGFEVVLKLGGVPTYTYTDQTVGTPFENVITVPSGTVADSVRVSLPGKFEYLQLNEVMVMGVAAAGASGDPHFKMWTGEKYDFHGACDLVLLQNPAYGNGLGMDIHIRTKFTEQWSYISTAVLKIGDETLEVMGGGKSKYWINKVEGQELSSGISGFPISRKEVTSISTEYEVDLKDGSVVFFKTYKNFVRVEIDRANSAYFAESFGMMGSYEGKKIARDGKTVVEDNNEFGLEWQVLPSEPMLFHNVEGAQAPEKCPLPVKSKGRRRLRESKISMKDAQIACARVSEEDRDSCIFDVMATNDKDMAGAY